MGKTAKPAGKSPGDAKREANPATRSAILDRLKRDGELSAGALGTDLGVTAMAVRLHLYELEAEGLVSSRSEPAGRGRPTKLWALTEDAARVFPDAHQSLAVEMIKTVEKVFGAEGLEKIITQHGDTQRAAYSAALKNAPSLNARVEALAKTRADEGYMAEAKSDGKDWILIENHCPICSAAKACTGICANELRVFSEVLGPDVSVEREEHILQGARRCAYRIKAQP